MEHLHVVPLNELCLVIFNILMHSANCDPLLYIPDDDLALSMDGEGYGYDQPGDGDFKKSKQTLILNHGLDKAQVVVTDRITLHDKPCYKTGYGRLPVTFAPSPVIEKQPVSSTVYFAQPPNYLGLSIITCMCCFWPIGIAATCYSIGSSNAAERMDFATAKSNGQIAKRLCIAAIICGITMYVLCGILIHKYVVMTP
ncbi:hypothetical protein LOTGIDRAFT_158349 [Lottia gigantea]|uniref:Proline-rich transmembrane protein 1 n=1 Tax=Lottia gigantea TaxID=225164 RepID=V4AYG4_LOTGI|nr:hypothetical protein LOTGIDRAFT_158349 [Lottia gigantea]ESP00121.1 hypothetical protein LOTGIDRAFT_158349 [Lottia gigantea]